MIWKFYVKNFQSAFKILFCLHSSPPNERCLFIVSFLIFFHSNFYKIIFLKFIWKQNKKIKPEFIFMGEHCLFMDHPSFFYIRLNFRIAHAFCQFFFLFAVKSTFSVCWKRKKRAFSIRWSFRFILISSFVLVSWVQLWYEFFFKLQIQWWPYLLLSSYSMTTLSTTYPCFIWFN